MNCKCLPKIEEEIKNTHPEWKGKKVVSVKIPKLFKFTNPVTTRTASEVEIKVEGQKKIYTVSLEHSFCPFCGVKQSNDQP
jgi:hypothetical protein